MHPPDPETRSPAKAGTKARAICEDVQQLEITPSDLQAQRLRRIYAFTLNAAYVVAELAYAAGPR